MLESEQFCLAKVGRPSRAELSQRCYLRKMEIGVEGIKCSLNEKCGEDVRELHFLGVNLTDRGL